MSSEDGISVTFSVLKSSYISCVDKSDLAVGGIMIDVPLMYEPMRNHHLIQESFGEETYETIMGKHDVDKDVSDILSDI